MRRRRLTLPLIGTIAVTRAMLGAGIGLLVSPYLQQKHRRAVGLALVGVGAASTVPIALKVFGRS